MEKGLHMPDGESLPSNVSLLDKNELKPGYILYEDITSVPGMRQGYVLSSKDIEVIQKSDKVEKIRVFQTDKSAEEPATLEKKAPTIEDVKKIDLEENERKDAVFSPEQDARLQRIVAMKKGIIRGDGYENKVEETKQETIDKFGAALKTIHTYQKEETLSVIDNYAKSTADLEGIEMVAGLKTRELVQKLDHYERNGEFFLNAALSQKKVYSSFVEEIVVDFINDVGYQLARALFSSVSKIDSFADYLAAHSLQVMIVSLITAIELTKMIKEKSDQLAASDLNTFLAISKKFYSLEDLVNLGIVALLHDIEIKNKFPHLHFDEKLGYEWDSILDLHPSNGFHICKKLNIDFDVQRAVYQHHERFDGSGFPNGLFPRFFSKFTPVIMFAEYYTELTTPNPFVDKIIPPRNALVNILSKERTKFDGDVIYAFIRAASLFPVGSWLMLSDGTVGIVIDVNKQELERPVLKVFFDKSLQRLKPFIVDLGKQDLKIVKPIDLYTIKKMAGEAMNFVFADN